MEKEKQNKPKDVGNENKRRNGCNGNNVSREKLTKYKGDSESLNKIDQYMAGFVQKKKKKISNVKMYFILYYTVQQLINTQ